MDDLKDFDQPIFKSKKDFETFEVKNSSRPARDETIEESADRYVWIHAGGDKPKSYDDPFIKKIDTMARLPKVNKLVDQKLSGNKTLNYINQNRNMYENENIKMLPTSKKKPQPTYDQQRKLHYERVWQVKNPKLGNLSIIKEPTAGTVYTSKLDQVAYPKPGTAPAEIAAAKKQKEEDKKSNEQFKKEYSDQAMKNYVRSKVNKNKREGKRDYENLSTSDMIVNEHAKDEAKKKLVAIKAEHVKLKPSYFDLKALEDTGPKLSLKEHMAKVAPKVIDPGGITDLKGVRKFRDTMNFANKKFPRKLGGGLAPLLGEDN